MLCCPLLQASTPLGTVPAGTGMVLYPHSLQASTIQNSIEKACKKAFNQTRGVENPFTPSDN
jgi:hypothetical protein